MYIDMIFHYIYSIYIYMNVYNSSQQIVTLSLAFCCWCFPSRDGEIFTEDMMKMGYWSWTWGKSAEIMGVLACSDRAEKVALFISNEVKFATIRNQIPNPWPHPESLKYIRQTQMCKSHQKKRFASWRSWNMEHSLSNSSGWRLLAICGMCLHFLIKLGLFTWTGYIQSGKLT